MSCRQQKFVTPRQSTITRKREVPQSNILVFSLISLTFSISSIIYHSRGKVSRGNPKKSLFCYIQSLVTKYQIWHPWALVILMFFIFLNRKKLSDLALISHDYFEGFFSFFNSLIYSFIYLFLYLFICLFIYLFIVVGSNRPPHWSTRTIFLQVSDNCILGTSVS